MTISTIDPSTPDNDDPAGLGAAQIRALKAALTAQFAGEVGDLWDTALVVGPRALNLISDKTSSADFDALESRVSVNELAIVSQANTFTDLDSRVTALEAVDTTGIAWPVGSVFISYDGSTPASKGISGTWSVFGNGRMLLGANGTGGSTGGADSVKLTEANLPSHKHQHTTFREDSGLDANVPAVYRTNPNTTFNIHRAGRDGSTGEYAIFNTDGGVNLSNNPTNVDIVSSYITVTFYRRTA